MPVTEYTWDPVTDSILEEIDGAGSVLASYTNEPSAYGPLVSQRRDGESRYFHFDALGSTRELTDDDESVTDTISYDAWGNEVVRAGITISSFSWMGRSGYVSGAAGRGSSVRLRVYNPNLGTWISVDKYIFQLSRSAYLYAANNPILFFDPSGAVAVENCGPNKKACIEEAVSEIRRAMEARVCFPTQNDNDKCRPVLEDCLDSALGGIKIECTKKLTGKTSNAPGACSSSRDSARKNGCSPPPEKCGEVPPDPGCGPCPMDLMSDSVVQIGSFDSLDRGTRYNWLPNPEDIGPLTCHGRDGRGGVYKELALLIVHEMLHHCVGGHFDGDKSRSNNPPDDSCGRPGVPELVKEFFRNCGS